MTILLNIMKYDYGDEKRGLSFEYETFYQSLAACGYKVILFDFMTAYQKYGKEKMNKLLLKKVQEINPNIVFTVLYGEQFFPATLSRLKNKHGKSMVWMCDDKWRWKNFGSKYAPYFNYVITTDPEAPPKYKKIGCNNVILSQWAHNPEIFTNTKTEKDIEVSFIGQINPWRKYVAKQLSKQGIKIECFGYGWHNGKINQKKMVEIINRSKINLNISNSIKWNIKYLLSSFSAKNLSPSTKFKQIPLFHTIFSKKRKEDIKARFFEVTGCGGFLLSYNVDYLDKYFEIGKELVCYENIPDLIQKIKYYLSHEKEREKIAQASYQRAQKEHTYKKRFEEILHKLKIEIPNSQIH